MGFRRAPRGHGSRRRDRSGARAGQGWQGIRPGRRGRRAVFFRRRPYHGRTRALTLRLTGDVDAARLRS